MRIAKKLVCDTCGHVEYTFAKHHTNRHCDTRMTVFGRRRTAYHPWADGPIS